MNEVSTAPAAKTDMAKIIYILYLVAFAAGITAIVGVVLAYMYKDDAPDWLKTHYELQIRTFWLGILYSIIAGILCLVLIGFVLFFVIAIWWIIRCVKGLRYLDQQQPYANHLGWLF